ncbi:hypothetical protein ACXYMU_06995 [Pontibacter sp. CAU 1760]
MDSKEYKRLTKQKSVLGLGVLKATLVEVKRHGMAKIAAEIERILTDNVIEKPALHNDSTVTSNSYYWIDLDKESIDEIVELMLDLETTTVGEKGETTSEASFYAPLLDKWYNLLR